MFTIPLTVLGTNKLRLLAPVNVLVQCSSGTGKLVEPPAGTGRGRRIPVSGLIRAKQPGVTRLGFVPEEWFQFLHPKTGVSGPYILMIGLANYVASKEILVMEHEYYSGLSVALVIYLITKNFGREIGAILDREVEALHDKLEQGRTTEIAQHVAVLEAGKLAKNRAHGQEILMAAKKENISFQLEAAYRERLMMVYRAVRDRLQYHLKRSRTEKRIQQRWMIQWILDNVIKSITPDFQKQALSSAIRDLASLASQGNK